MKKALVICFFVCFSIFRVFSQENNVNNFNSNSFDEYYFSYFEQFGIRILCDASLKFFFPTRNDYTGFFSSLSMGTGIGIDIFDHILSPGIYFNIDLGTNWSLGGTEGLTLFDAETNDNNQFELGFGLRLYNIMKFYPITVSPFVGYNAVFLGPYPNFGITLSYKNIGLEYAYYFSTKNDMINHHHISIKIIFDDYLKDLEGFKNFSE
jgi:hypothetical protein